jgi:RimJ/RimL family protein N-acetyltransferase
VITPTVAPRLTTDRLVLRQLEARDFETFAEQFMNADAMAPLSPLSDRRAAWQKLAAFNGMWTLTGTGWWGVELRETSELAGTVGAFFRESGDDLEIGWTVFPRHRKKGIAVESARAALAHAFAHHAVKRAIAHVDAPNIASVRVCESLGMSLEGEVDFYGTRLNRYVVRR